MRRRLLTWTLLLGLASALLAFVPGFDVLSFYFCLPVALLVGMASGGVAVTTVAEARTMGHTVLVGWIRSLKAAGALLTVPLLVIGINSFRVEPCDLGYGLWFYILGPVLSGLVGAVSGSFLGTMIARQNRALLAFYALFVVTFALDGPNLYWEPAVFFFNPFLGYYPGPIYDDRIDVSSAYLWFRILCLSGVGGLASLAWAVKGPDFRFRLSRRLWPWAALVLSIGAFSALRIQSGDLGFIVDRGRVEEELSGSASNKLCRIHHDTGISPDTVRRLLEDCSFRHRQAADFFGLQPGEPVRLYLYRDAEQKARLMGTGQVEVAKPWLGEVHLLVTIPGDHVLGHEIAHVVAGRLARSPFGVPTRFGIVPDMALVEGLAVACAFASDGPSPHEWSLAMSRSGVAADPADLLGPTAFLTSHPGRAYTVAGSFVRFIGEAFGTAAIQGLAAGQGLEEATGMDVPSLSARWLEYIESRAGKGVDSDLVNRASGRFSGPGVLGRRCPVDTARLVDRARSALESGRLEEARTCLQEARGYDPDNRAFLRAMARLQGLAGDGEEVREIVTVLAIPGNQTARPVVPDLLAAADALSFLAFSRNETVPSEARAHLEEAAALVGGGPRGRSIRARLSVAALDPDAAREVFQVLTGRADNPAVSLASAASMEPDSPMIHYLLGKALVGGGEYGLAVDHLRTAQALGLPDGRFEAEAEKVLGKAAFWADDMQAARKHLAHALVLAPHEGDRLVIEEYLMRIASLLQSGPRSSGSL